MSYEWGLLGTMYEGFMQQAASCEISINDVLILDSSNIMVYDVEVNLSSESIAGSCSFKISDLWQHALTDWDPLATANIRVGAPVSVKLGYMIKNEVFYGYIDSFTYVYPEKGRDPFIQVYALDALGFLMGVRDCIYAGENDTGTVVKKMLNACVSARAAKKASTGMAPVQDFAIQRIKSGMSNYDFLKILAEQTGRKFFAVKGEVMFEDVMAYTVPLFLMPIPYAIDSIDGGFYHLERTLSLERQPSKVIVRGRDVDNNAIKAEVSMSTLATDGMLACMAASSILGEAVYDEDSPLVRTQMDCMTLAQNRFNMLAMNYVRVRGVCAGVPEMVPGRFLKIDGVGMTAAGTYLITGVKHTFTNQGGSYKTEVEMRGASSL